MRLEHYSEEKLKREIMEIVGAHLDTSRYDVFFFGSRVAGGGDERSDIDVGIEGPNRIDRGALARIREDVAALPTLYTIEVVDFDRVPREFYEVAKQHTEPVVSA